MQDFSQGHSFNLVKDLSASQLVMRTRISHGISHPVKQRADVESSSWKELKRDSIRFSTENNGLKPKRTSYKIRSRRSEFIK